MAGLLRGVRPMGLWSMSMTLSISVRPEDPVVIAHHHVAAVEGSGHRGVEDLVHEGALARPRDPGDAGEHAEGEVDGDVLEVVLAGAHHRDLLAVAPAPFSRQLDPQVVAQVAAGEAVLVLLDLRRRARRHDLAPVAPRARAEVHHPVGLFHGLAVVLDHDHRVADVAQVLERGQELAVVALVEADRRLVEDVHDAGELAADLAGQADALALAPGKRGSRAVEGEVVEAHVEEELEARADLLEELHRDLRVRALEVELGEELVGVGHGQTRDLRDVAARDLDPQGLGAHAPAPAGRAGPVGEELLVVLAHLLGVRLAHAAHHRVDGALVAHLEGAGAPGAAHLHAHPLVAGAVEQHLAVGGGQVLPGLVEVDSPLLGHRAHDVGAPARPFAHRPQGFHRPLVDREARVGDDEVGIHLHARAQARALGAHALRRVEGEELGAGLGEGDAAGVAGPVLGEDLLGLALGGDHHDALAVAQGRLHRVGEPLLHVGLGHEAVDHRVDRVLLLLVEADLVLDGQHDAVHPHAG